MRTLGNCFCGQPATQTLCDIEYCHPCAETILAPIRKQVAQRHGTGFGEQVGPLRPDWGEHYADLQCSVCEAGWVGPIGEPCTWCQDALEHMQQWQAEILLHPDLPDPSDARYEAAAIAWAERVGRGVTAGLVTPQQAIRALEREARR
jgi:hypothetical protein